MEKVNFVFGHSIAGVLKIVWKTRKILKIGFSRKLNWFENFNTLCKIVRIDCDSHGKTGSSYEFLTYTLGCILISDQGLAGKCKCNKLCPPFWSWPKNLISRQMWFCGIIGICRLKCNKRVMSAFAKCYQKILSRFPIMVQALQAGSLFSLIESFLAQRSVLSLARSIRDN